MGLTSMFQHRLELVRGHLDQWQVDTLLLNSPTNRRWLTGFSGSAGWVLITADNAILATDSRYWLQAEDQAPDYSLVRLARGVAALQAFIREEARGRVGLERQYLTLEIFDQLQAVALTWQPLPGPVDALRAVKADGEIEAIQNAARLTDQVMERVPQLVRPGMTEKALAWELEKALREAGADGLAFPIIVASGPNGARPHHRPGDRRLAAGDNLTIDMGASLDGYHSDLTRTFFLGREPDEAFWQTYRLVQEAQEAALQGMKAGQTGRAIDGLARQVIEAAGQGAQFGHSLGHGVGLDVHEEPRLAASNEAPIPAGAVVTVEPGVYLAGWGGVRLEDLVLVTDAGAQLLSHCPKRPAIPL